MADRHVNKADLATLAGVTVVTIGQWVSRGCPYVQKGGPGRSWVFDVPDVWAWREEQRAQQALGDTTSLDLDEARRRKLAAEAAMSELDLAKRKGELVEIEDVAAVVGDDYANVRAKLLSLPTKVGPQLIGVDDPAEARALVERAITEALEELTADGIYGGPEESDQEPEAGEPQAAA